MRSRYLFLKCVAATDQMSDKPSRILRLTELQQLVEADSELQWGLEPHGTIPVKNSDGTVAMMPPCPGFSFSRTTVSSPFFICYKFCDGLAIHPEGDDRVDLKARQFAERLKAKLFVI